MDAETLKEVEHLLDDQLPKIRRAYEDAIKDGCKDPVVWLFSLELEDSLEVACDIFGEGLREQLEAHQRRDAIPSCLLPIERQDAIRSLAARLKSSGVAEIVGKRQAPAPIRVVVFYGPDAAVFDVSQSDGERSDRHRAELNRRAFNSNWWRTAS
jgi:hypothetical protein